MMITATNRIRLNQNSPGLASSLFFCSPLSPSSADQSIVIRPPCFFMDISEIDPLKDDGGNKAESHGNQPSGQLHGIHSREHGGVHHRDAPGHETHAGDGRLGDDHGGGMVKLHLFIDRQHNGEYDQVCGSHCGGQHSHGRDDGGDDHHHVHVQSAMGELQKTF